MGEAATNIQARNQDIEASIAGFKKQQADLWRKRDKELLTATVEFVKQTGARITAPPKQGAGGTLHVAGMQSMRNDEITEFLKDLPQSGNGASTKITKDVDAVVAKQRRLEMIRHLGGRQGLEGLI